MIVNTADGPPVNVFLLLKHEMFENRKDLEHKVKSMLLIMPTLVY